MIKFLIIFISIIFGLFLLFAIINAVIFIECFTLNKNKPVKMKVPDEFKKVVDEGYNLFLESEKEDVFIKSKDNLSLHGYFIKGSTRADMTVICFHGYKSSVADFSGAFTYYKKSGCNILMVDQRAHGKSHGKIITFGVKESDDTVLWADYIKNRVGGIIYLAGISMGASTVLFASGKKLPKEVNGIIADCGFTSPSEIIKYVSKTKYHVPAFINAVNMFFISIYAKLCGFSIYEKTTSYISKCNIPIILSHGKADRFVPCEMSIENEKFCSCQHELVLVENARHGYAYVVNPAACYEAIQKTFKENSPVCYEK